MPEFLLEGLDSKPVRVTYPGNVTRAQLEKFPAFCKWKTTLSDSLAQQYTNENHPFHENPYQVKSVDIQSVDWFGPNIGFVKLHAEIKAPGVDSTGKPRQPLPGICFLRGGSVAVLMILRPKDSRDERWVVMTEQPRIPAGNLSFLEIPAGMIDKEEDFSGAAAKEIEEETGFKIPRNELIDMTGLALLNAGKTNLQPAMYPSPGGCDEFITLFLWEKDLDRQEIEDLQGIMTGQRRQGEMITLRICAYEDVWREGARDAKTLAAWALYEGLNRSGVLQREKSRRMAAAGEIL
jgi:ADP-sugar diphosphatase